MKAEILAVGTEILLGDIVNTNAQFLARELANMGIFVYHQGVVGDNEERLTEAYSLAFGRSDLVLATGGLGPTKDDLTKEVASKYFDKQLVEDQYSRELLEGFFAKRGLPMSPGNLKQAYFPEGAIILANPNGTAPGCIIEKDGKILVLMPGPPREMIPMFKNHVVPYLAKYQDCVLASRVLRFCCIGESAMEERIKDLIEGQSNPTIAPYAKEGEVTLRITAKANTKEEAEKLIAPLQNEIYSRLGHHIYGIDDDTLEKVVAKRLIEKNATIAIAESCSGGLLSARLVNYPGISKVLLESVVCYSNQSKVSRLGVSEHTLESFGAVSQETARKMAEGIAKTAGSDIGISITGIAGPQGGSDQKPVGLVYIGLYYKGQTKVKELSLFGDRQRIRNFSVIYALDFLRKELQ